MMLRLIQLLLALIILIIQYLELLVGPSGILLLPGMFRGSPWAR